MSWTVRGLSRHIRRYFETDGEKGHSCHGMNSLLTARGRKSGKLHDRLYAAQPSSGV
jgi:hypothetical protein